MPRKDPEKRKEYYQENREKILARHKLYRKDNKNKIKKAWQKWYKENYREYRQKNKDRILENAAKFRKNHKERRRLDGELYRKNNVVELKKRRKKHYLNGGKEYFKKYSKTENGKMVKKKSCRKYNLKANYGLTLEQFDQMLELQNGLCVICGKPEKMKSRYGGTRHLCIDHNHETGEARELLCNDCNLVIGHSCESIEVLASAIKYLQKHL